MVNVAHLHDALIAPLSVPALVDLVVVPLRPSHSRDAAGGHSRPGKRTGEP